MTPFAVHTNMSSHLQSPLAEKHGKPQKKEGRNGSPWKGVGRGRVKDQTSMVEDDTGGKEELMFT